MSLVNYGFLKPTEIGLIQKSEKDINLGHQQKLSFILCFHMSLPTTSVRPLSLWERVHDVCVMCLRASGGETERDGKKQMPHTLGINCDFLGGVRLSSASAPTSLAGLQIVICWRQKFVYIKETVASSSTTSQQSFHPTTNTTSWFLLCWRRALDYPQLQQSDDSWHHHSIRIQPKNSDYQLHQFLGNDSKLSMSRKSYSVN